MSTDTLDAIKATYGERYDRLPRWAKDEIERLARDLAAAERDLDELTPGTDRRGLVELRQGISDRRALPVDSRVRWNGRQGVAQEGWIEAVYDAASDSLELRAAWDITVRPMAGNAVAIQLVRRDHEGG